MTISMQRRALLAALPALAGAAGAARAQAAYPSKPVRFVVPYAVGQGGDIIARLVADELSRDLGQPFVIENRPGAGGNVGSQLASKAPADGYTMLLGSNATHAANEFMYSSLGFDPARDFEPVALLGVLPLAIATTPANPVSTVPDLVRAARARPDALNVAVSTSTCRVTYELFKQKAGAPLFPVDFKGAAQSITAVMGGHVEYVIDTIAALRGSITNGQLKPIAVTSRAATRLLPGVRSVAEQGVTDFELVGWIAVYMPKGSPPEAVRTVGTAIATSMGRPEVQARMLQLGLDARALLGAEFAAFGAAERDKWGQLIRGAGLKAE